MFISEELLVEIRQYIKLKTGTLYFKRIKLTPENIMISCPYHKNGQEDRPSCGIKRVSDENGSEGTLHCFSCGKVSDLLSAVKYLLGDKYNEDEVEARFGLATALAREAVIQSKKGPIVEFVVPTHSMYVKESLLRTYRTYNPYLQSRGISESTAKKYDVGYDSYNDHITFPIRDMYKHCLGVGRRAIKEKKYIYPDGFVKPLYGIYELPRFINHLWIVEGPFNLWSLNEYGKTGIGLLGTGTNRQMKQLLDVECDDYVLALDGDEAGHNGIRKIGNFLKENHKKVFVACVPDSRDINDMGTEQFYNMDIIPFNEWKFYMNKIY